MQEKKKITSLNDVLATLFHELKIEDRMAYARLYTTWRHAVGEQISRNAHPAGLRGGILFVNVASSVWMQQLAFLKQEILDKLTAAPGLAHLKDIRFRIGPLPQAPGDVAEEPLPELSEQEREEISRQTEVIADPELRDIFRGLIAAHRKNRKQREA